MHDAGIKFVVETARPVSTGYSFVQKLPVDAVAYLNGALLDFNPVSSDYDMPVSYTHLDVYKRQCHRRGTPSR